MPKASPALRGEQFCYFHRRMLRTVNTPDSRVHHAALLEDEEATQVSLMEVVNGLMRGTIELKRGEPSSAPSTPPSATSAASNSTPLPRKDGARNSRRPG
ncbi:MAG TPA: hypothetical protein VMQ17_09465 [Candidatus Sulfotelmatobacter sp.]|nr:hypothetical protein [Candidatus Sulfotelmatobacter sp.]